MGMESMIFLGRFDRSSMSTTRYRKNPNLICAAPTITRHDYWTLARNRAEPAAISSLLQVRHGPLSNLVPTLTLIFPSLRDAFFFSSSCWCVLLKYSYVLSYLVRTRPKLLFKAICKVV